MSTQETAAKLNELVQELEDQGQLQGYAAKAAAAMLVENWEAALRDGNSIGNLVGDVDEVISLLTKFKAAAAAIATEPAAPGM